jgi:aconitate hydratase
MQDFTGVPACRPRRHARRDRGARAATRERSTRWCRSTSSSTTRCRSTLRHAAGARKNVELEYERNRERYEFLRWGQQAFDNFRVVPPGTGIVHQVNLEYLARWCGPTDAGRRHDVAYPDTLVGTDSHTTMVNGLGVLGWGVGGIEAEAAMLGQPISMLIPRGRRLQADRQAAGGRTATDLVLTVTEMLRKQGVVGKFVEFYGPGLAALPLADRATIANMAPEYGATCGFFPVDDRDARLPAPHRPRRGQVALVEAYAKEQGCGATRPPSRVFTDTLELDLGDVVPSLAGPKRPQDRVALDRRPRASSPRRAGDLQEAPASGQAASEAGDGAPST